MVIRKSSRKLNSSPRILWVDDEPDTTGVYFLNMNDLDIDLASTVDVAIRKLRENKYALVITDIMLPGSDAELEVGLTYRHGGLELIETIRSRELNDNAKAMPILVCTAMGSLELLTK